jgi:hypothetical protein
MESMIPDFDIQSLAQEMIKHFPADAADRRRWSAIHCNCRKLIEIPSGFLTVR